MFRTLPFALQQKSEDELNENPKQVKSDIHYIRKWISQQPHLHNVVITDQLIINFLRGCKFSLEKAKEKLDNYYSMKTLLPEFYQNRDPFLPEIQEILSLGTFLPLPKPTEEAGPRIILLRCLPKDPSNIIFANAAKTTFMIIDILLNEDDNFVIAGQHGFIDLSGMNFKHVTYLDLNICKKGAICLQQAYPTRPKGFHVTNVPSFFEIFYNLVRQFANEKVRKRVKVYNASNLEEMLKTIPESMLPEEYGGNGSSLKDLTDHWKKKVESYRDWFLEDSKYCSDESKRPGKQKTVSDMFGVEGSFRRLDVD